MSTRPFTRAALSLLVFTAPLGAQAAPKAAAPASEQLVEPGMTREQVVARLGRPGGIRAVGSRTYLFYANGRERRAGMNDVVFLENDAVVDAIFRAPHRRYTGTSSSSTGVRPAATNVVMPAAPSGMPAAAEPPGRSTTLPTIATPAGDPSAKPPVRAAPAEPAPTRRP